jgi:GT2 family glycosyltransferase
VITTYARVELLRGCLEGVAAQQPTPEEIIVVHRLDDEETATFLEDWAREDPSRRRPVAVERRGIIPALLAGTEAARSDIVAYIDDDAVPRAGWLAKLLEQFQDPAVGAAGGPFVDHWGERVITGSTRRVGRVTWYGRVIGRHSFSTGYQGDVELLAGANMAFRRDLAHHEERLLHGSTGLALGNELDACLTVRRLGYRVRFTPQALVDHYTTSFRDKELGTRVVGADVSASAANYQFALLRFLSRPRRLAFRIYGYSVGSASTPGPGRALLEVFRSPARARAMAKRVGLTWRGRLQGEQMYQQWLNEDRPCPTRASSKR